MEATFFQSCYLVFQTQKFATYCKEQKKKRIMTIGQKTERLFKVRTWQKNAQKAQNF